ncbi:MAG: LruC domain-containing protein [Byssovorax sp.]
MNAAPLRHPAGRLERRARHFVDNRGIPNALDVPQSIKWSKETVDISGGYSQLAAFGASGGVSNQTWYQSPTNASLFTSGQGGAQPPGASFIGGADASFTVDGTCNLCVANNVSCPAAPDQCHDQGTCAPATGVCSAAPAKANGTSCDDGNSGTVNDICTNGTCAGTPSSGPCTPGSLSVGAAVNLAGSFAAAPSNFHPQGMGLAADGTSFSVVLQSTQQIRLMNPQTGALVSSTGISNGLNHTTGIAWDPGNSRYFVADYTSNNSGIDLWSVTSGGSASQASNEVSAYGGYPLAVGNGRLYRGSIISNTYDWTNLTQIRVSNVGTPDSIITTLSPGIGGIEDMAWDGAALWVLGYTPDANTDTPINLYRVDPTSGAVLGSYPNVATSGANRRASGLEYLNGTLYVFNWSSGGTSTLLPISTGCGALPAGCALASDNTVWCATQTVNQTGSQICGYPDGYAGTYYPITAAGAAALGRTIVGYGDCATNYYSGAQIQGSSMSCWTDAQRWARNGTSTNGQATGGNVVRCTNLENGAFSAAYATVHVDSGSKDIALVYAPSGTSFSSNADYKAYCESKGFKQNQNSNSAAPYQTAGMYDASSYYCNQHCCFLGSGNSVWANSASNFVNHGLPTSTPLQVFDRGCAQWCSGSFVNDLNTSDTITVNGANSASYNVNAIGGGSNYCAAKSNAFSQNGVVVCEMP